MRIRYLRGVLILVAGAIWLLVAALIVLRLTAISRPPPRPQAYVCPLQDTAAVVVKATCTDCLLYPVDKSHTLSATYAPTLVDTGLPGGGQVSITIRDPLERLFKDANARGLYPVVTSAYRSYQEQVQVFKGWFFQEWRAHGNIFVGFQEAARYSAYPGHSEHQLGTAVDVNCRGCTAFNTDDPRNVALWEFLEQNAHRYGFVISYPRNMEERTGYQYEPWHIRYIGVDNATVLYDEGYLTGNGSCAAALLRAKQAQ